MLQVDWLVFLDGLDLGTDDGNLLWLWDGKPIGTTLGSMDGFPYGKYDGADLGWSEGSTGLTSYGDIEGMFIGAWQHLDLWMWYHLLYIMVQC